MAKTLLDLLDMAWNRQAEHLHGLTERELEVLLNQLSRMQVNEIEREAFDRFFLATYSILRDRREEKKKGKG